jgi:hypothetical protein
MLPHHRGLFTWLLLVLSAVALAQKPDTERPHHDARAISSRAYGASTTATITTSITTTNQAANPNPTAKPNCHGG